MIDTLEIVIVNKTKNNGRPDRGRDQGDEQLLGDQPGVHRQLGVQAVLQVHHGDTHPLQCSHHRQVVVQTNRNIFL